MFSVPRRKIRSGKVENERGRERKSERTRIFGPNILSFLFPARRCEEASGEGWFGEPELLLMEGKNEERGRRRQLRRIAGERSRTNLRTRKLDFLLLLYESFNSPSKCEESKLDGDEERRERRTREEKKKNDAVSNGCPLSRLIRRGALKETTHLHLIAPIKVSMRNLTKLLFVRRRMRRIEEVLRNASQRSVSSPPFMHVKPIPEKKI